MARLFLSDYLVELCPVWLLSLARAGQRVFNYCGVLASWILLLSLASFLSSQVSSFYLTVAGLSYKAAFDSWLQK
jgi:hypothetical protein